MVRITPAVAFWSAEGARFGFAKGEYSDEHNYSGGVS
jgi:hypothetical protein